MRALLSWEWRVSYEQFTQNARRGSLFSTRAAPTAEDVDAATIERHSTKVACIIELDPAELEGREAMCLQRMLPAEVQDSVQHWA